MLYAMHDLIFQIDCLSDLNLPGTLKSDIVTPFQNDLDKNNCLQFFAMSVKIYNKSFSMF